jgi:hypothetical protein
MKTILTRLRRLGFQTTKILREYTHRINFLDDNGAVDGSLVLIHGGPSPRSYELDRFGRQIEGKRK